MKVQIALIVNSAGKYNACGWSLEGTNIQTCFDTCIDGMADFDETDAAEQKYIVEVEVDIPEIKTVQGHIRKVENSK